MIPPALVLRGVSFGAVFRQVAGNLLPPLRRHTGVGRIAVHRGLWVRRAGLFL